MMNWLEKQSASYWPYLLVSICVLGPLLQPGYVLTMDMVFVPHPPIPEEVNASFPFYVLLHYLSYVVPGDVLQKIILLSVLFFAGVGMHRLVVSLPIIKLSRTAAVGASLFYMLNPFVYERLMMGQFAVVAGYALLPFVVLSLHGFFEEPTWRRTWQLMVLIFVVSILSIHTLVPVGIAGLLFGIAAWRNWRTFCPKLAAGLFGLVIASGYWIIPTLMESNTIAAALTTDSTRAFSTQGGIFSLLRLQGFWAEYRGLFRMPEELTPLPGLWQTAVWVTLVAGIVRAWHKWREGAILYGAMIVIGCVVAIIGFGSMYREPHKIMTLAALGMSVLMAVGADGWLTNSSKRLRSVYAKRVFICTVPLLLGLGMFWGFSGQLSSRAYPPEWYALNEMMKGLSDDKSAVFVPWHLYQRYSFSPRLVANPAATFFEGRKVIVSNDPEFAGVRSLRDDEHTSSVGRLLAARPDDIARRLQGLGVAYVIFAREPGYEDYEYLRLAKGLDEIFHSGRLTLYRVEATR